MLLLTAFFVFLTRRICALWYYFLWK